MVRSRRVQGAESAPTRRRLGREPWRTDDAAERHQARITDQRLWRPVGESTRRTFRWRRASASIPSCWMGSRTPRSRPHRSDARYR